MKVITNNHRRSFIDAHDVPDKVLEWYDWLDENATGWICYQGHWTHITDYMRGGVEGWDGYSSDSFFSGTLIKLLDDKYIIGRYIS